jgi:hypothetical protein
MRARYFDTTSDAAWLENMMNEVNSGHLTWNGFRSNSQSGGMLRAELQKFWETCLSR